MQPINERGGVKYFEGNYGPNGHNPARAKKMGNTKPGDGAKYHGRGYVQLTWKVNYEAMSKHLEKAFGKKIDLIQDPDLALQKDYAAEIMFHGMNVGMFTGKKFLDYFTKNADGSVAKDNWRGARAMINGNDKAQVIADFARTYYSAIAYT
jgi:putative chitinase